MSDTDDRPVLFNFHGYPSAVHQLIHRRPVQERFSVRGYSEEGTTTTPFELLAMNGVDRFSGLSGGHFARPVTNGSDIRRVASGIRAAYGLATASGTRP